MMSDAAQIASEVIAVAELPRVGAGINEMRRWFYAHCCARADWHRHVLRNRDVLTPEQIRFHIARLEIEQRAASAWFLVIGAP